MREVGTDMGKHSDSSGRTGNPNQGQGRHVDTARQPTGRDPGLRDRTPDSHYEGKDNDVERGGRYDR